MEQKLFLEKNRDKFSNDVERSINMGLSTKTRMLPSDDALDEFSLFEQYNRERDECNKYRLILNVNPVCTNILFNARTEIVVNEGSDNCNMLIGDDENKIVFSKNDYAPKALNTKREIDYMHAIRNTEYSHKENGGFVYHCGFDIFNNHMLRKKSFVHINKAKNEIGQDNYDENYNTLFDFVRDANGNRVEEDLNVDNANGQKKTQIHVYQYDTIMSMPVAFSDNCIEKDGWWGFTNPNTIELPNSDNKTISINRMMANNKACEFIDLYPDRSLFSFVPKFNKHRRRIEKNWDYCLTYPYKSDYTLIDTLCGGKNQTIKANIKQTFNNNGQEVIQFSSFFKHNLKVGDYVRIYYYIPTYNTLKEDDSVLEENMVCVKINGNEYIYKKDDIGSDGKPKNDDNSEPEALKIVVDKTFTKYSQKVKVNSLGDYTGDLTDRIFSIKLEDVEDIAQYLVFFGSFYKRINKGGIECSYYARKFKKISAHNGDNIKSDVNKVAFGTNIYGDDVAQIIFMDDIDLSGLLDNNGRPISEIYFTTIKRNAGHKEWYKRNFSGDTIEFSHCFGKVTSAIDFCGIEDEPFDYNIHYLHNIDKPSLMTSAVTNTFNAWGDTLLNGIPKVLEDNITIENFDEFYGDIVEYDSYKATETVIGNVYHRFNTEQREIWNKDFMHIKQDAIIFDDYDYDSNGNGKKFECSTYYVNNVKNPMSSAITNHVMYGNILPEGYFYNPHTKIQIRENDYKESSSPAKHLNYDEYSIVKKKTYIVVDERNNTVDIYDNYFDAETNKGDDGIVILQNSYYEININSPVNYGFYKGDYVAFYDKETAGIAWGEIINVCDLTLTIKIDNDDFNMVEYIDHEMFDPYSINRRFYAYWSPNNVPLYAKLCETTKQFVWKKIINPSEVMQGAETYNMPFTNGCFYVEKNLNFFLKRQDPNGKYGLSAPLHKKYSGGVTNPMTRFAMGGHEPLDFSDIMYLMNNLNNTCF